MMAAIYASIMMLWQWGSTRKHAYFNSQSVPLDSFLRMSDAVRAAWPSCKGLGYRVYDVGNTKKHLHPSRARRPCFVYGAVSLRLAAPPLLMLS